ncbi:MAG: YihY/virulence factor BrkB family protein [Bacilli bacterium]|nr:YihY/virulence factor BrkB family protein [Bacilli bacterium]
MKKEFNKILKLISKPYMRILPGNIAFSFMMALIPILSVIVSVCGMLNLAYPVISDKLNNIIPSAVLDTILTFLNGNGFNNVLLLIVGIWSASAGMDALIIASNVMYGYENTTYISRKKKALILTFLIILIIVINLGILVFGNTFVRFIVNIFNLTPIILLLFSSLKWPIAVILIFFILKIIYTAAPDIGIKSRYVNKGALFTTIFWMVSSAIYSFYVTNFANYTMKYGSLANIMILLIWLYLISYIMVLGTAINVNEYNKNIK